MIVASICVDNLTISEVSVAGLLSGFAVSVAAATGSFGGSGPKVTTGDFFFSVDNVTSKSLISWLSFGQAFNMTVASPFFLSVTRR